jgi:hypothetical protein
VSKSAAVEVLWNDAFKQSLFEQNRRVRSLKWEFTGTIVVRSDAVRIDSSSPHAPKSLEHVAFRSAASARGAGNAGAVVLVVVNTSRTNGCSYSVGLGYQEWRR